MPQVTAVVARAHEQPLQLHIKRVIGEGNVVATHPHLVLEPRRPGRVLADFFLLEDGKVVEHWDVIQDIPDSVDPDSMF